MKKLAFATLLGFASTAAFAAPVGQTFTGVGVGLDLTSTKYEHVKRATGVGVVADYGIDYGNHLVGLVEGKVKLNKSKLLDRNDGAGSYAKVDEKWRASVSYLQGYRVLPDLLPYVKVGYSLTKFSGKDGETTNSGSIQRSVSETKGGFNYGLGAKYAISSNFEVGAEYLRGRIKFDGESLNSNTFGANATYRF